MTKSNASGLMLLLLLAVTSSAHTWVEQLMVIAPNGTFIGSPGYPRGNVPRTAPNFNDGTMTHILTSTGASNTTVKGDMCMNSQKKQVQSPGNPRLQAAAGDPVALRYQENGHVTLPETQAGKPKNRGTVYVYGTTNPKDNDQLEAIHKVWNKDGSGGDKRGVLLSTQDFDDGQCYQINGGAISKERQNHFPHQADQLMGADLWCQQDIKLPQNLPSDKPYTLYWVWDWPTAQGVDPSLPAGKQEIYTTCMDVDVVSKPNTQQHMPVKYADGQSLNSAAVKARFIGTMGASFDVPIDDGGKGATSTSQGTGMKSATSAPSPTPTGSQDDQNQDEDEDEDEDASSTSQDAVGSVTLVTSFSAPTGTRDDPDQDENGDESAGGDDDTSDSSVPAVFVQPSISSTVPDKVTVTTFMTMKKTVHPSGCSGSH
ncbi:uncharacterized protein KD926_011470 [Aspergillus affinis]|uniref:uncharacterized protein n=1 Tax=Aspergillus affinis TaxID=1070780 RepID=UPI0022FE3F4F|nr:uncharacterized protein KD926_011470 [Aspergillus affinis]KAI9037947.1 hypothetical protein KD926_011470 [Aspergillus affinis]